MCGGIAVCMQRSSRYCPCILCPTTFVHVAGLFCAYGERGWSMIDYHALTFAEKFIAYVLSNGPPMRQQQIIDRFGLNDGNLRKILKSLVEQGIVASFTNELNVTLYYASDVSRPSTDVPRPPVSSPFHEKSVQENINSNLKKERKKGIQNFQGQKC